MGKVMQRRLVRKLELETFLSHIDSHPFPKPNLEQYTIPTDVAATMLHMAAYTYDDVIDKTILDLGCGTGRLALGAAFLGARHVVGIDVDRDATKVAFENSVKTGLKEKVQWITGDIDALQGSFDTVLQNPPFGIQKRRADRKFVRKALESAKVIYSLHRHPERDRILLKKLKTQRAHIPLVTPSPFLEKFVEDHRGKIRAVHSMIMTVPHMFSFHCKKRHEFIVDLFVIEKK
ncbi:methyltransferase [Candidatus Bathyarchaeota archaeon]|nr:methyltransferase [Candidatus Bathyarchaeota archaeon]